MNSTFFTKGILFVLLCFSVISWAIMIHKFIFVRKYAGDIARFLSAITGQNAPMAIEDSCLRFSTGKARALPMLILKLFRASGLGKKEPVQSAINTAIMNESAHLQGGMGMLATAASVSPLLGLLGTVWGVMYSFMNIGKVGSASIAAVAPGIAEALMTTIGGLLVAIPAMAGHSLISGVINRCLDVLDRVSEIAVSALSRE
jgi:biopolymer transport protein TolQ